jgi:small subunit ribosomal protein S4
MARYRGPVCRLQRRSGRNLFLKSAGSKANARMSGALVPPGQHGATQARGKVSTYGQQLREKQALRWMYGVLEKQFRRYVAEAKRRKGVAGTLLLQILETRIDNFVYRCGFAVTRAQARQFVRHGHFLLNGKPINIPSARVKPGDVITPTEKALSFEPMRNALETHKDVPRKPWIEFNPESNTGKFLAAPSREDLNDVPVDEQLIIEFYSR